MKVHSHNSKLQERRKESVTEQVPFTINGEMNYADKKMENGALETLEISKPVGEMMTNATTRKELMRKVTLDVELGREQVPTLYQPIYERIQDSNFPKEFEAKWAQYGNVVFFEHMEGEEVHFGSLSAEQGPIAHIKGFAAGFEYTTELEKFNQTFNLELLNRAFGEAHNAILNHLHFGPILKFNYKAANKTAAKYMDVNGKELDSATDSHIVLSTRATLKAALTDTRKAKRPGTVLLASEADREQIEEAMGSFTMNATPYRALEGVQDVIYYDGWEAEVGQKKYEYNGVPEGKAYLIRPKRGFKELIKQPLQINSTMGDQSRLVEAQVIGDFWRGVFAAVEENVQEITLPGKN